MFRETGTRLVRVVATAVVALAAPITLSARGTPTFADCGAAEAGVGTCCKQTDAICNGGKGDYDGYCYTTNATCSTKPGDPCGNVE